MAFPLLPATLLLIAGGLATLNFFVPPEAGSPAPDTEPIEPEYIPPFTGGQCAVQYRVAFIVTQTGQFAGTKYGLFSSSIGLGDNPPSSGVGTSYLGAIEGISIVSQNGSDALIRLALSGNRESFGTCSYGIGASNLSNIGIFRLERVDGQPDNCGDLPNPNPPFPISGTGLAQSAAPDLVEDTEPLTLGLVPLNLAALLAAAKAALAAAATLAELANAIAEVLDLIAKLIDELKPENRDKNKSTFLYQYGSIEKDGFLRFYGDVSNDGFEAIYLDILFTDIPNGIGKYFGELSPNRYIYNRLGYIAFVSPSLGVMEVRELEFPRQSFSVPKDSIGFFYHLGLNGSIKANASAIYEKEELPVE